MASALAEILERGTIRIGYATDDFAAAVRGLLEEPLLARGAGPARVDEIVECVVRREAAGSTRAGSIALPHARVAGISEIVVGLGVGPNGVMLAFVSPLEAAGEHLRFLSMAAKTFRDAALVQRIQAAGSRDELLAVFTNAELPSR